MKHLSVAVPGVVAVQDLPAKYTDFEVKASPDE